jgi:hypothetical protein
MAKTYRQITPYELEHGYKFKSLGWANGWSKEQEAANKGRASDWMDGWRNESGSTNVVYSHDQKLFYLYDCSG